MNPIKLNGGAEVEAKRTTARLDAAAVTDANATPQKGNPTVPQASDSINVSERAAAISELTAKIEQLPDVRGERVEQLRALVQAGNYQPPATEIADALLKDEQGLTGTI